MSSGRDARWGAFSRRQGLRAALLSSTDDKVFLNFLQVNQRFH